MKKYLLKIALFFALMFVIDMVCGWAFGLLRNMARSGQTFKNEYIYRECDDDILILGSSKADHHYLPSVFEDSLGLTCFNAGEMGCGIIPAYIRYNMVRKRHKPKLVLYEVTPSYDYLQDNDYSSYLGVIRQYAYIDLVRKVIIDFSDRFEGFKIISSLYRNNSKLMMNIKNVFSKPDQWKGYEPLYGKLSRSETLDTIQKDFSVDSLKWSYMLKLAQEIMADSVQLIYIISPVYKGGGNGMSEEYAPIVSLCEKHNLPLINNLSLKQFECDKEYYQDEVHLNHNGAICYSQFVVGQIKKLDCGSQLIFRTNP